MELAPRPWMEGTAMRLKRSYRYSLEELPLSKAKGMRNSSPSSTGTSSRWRPTELALDIRPWGDQRGQHEGYDIMMRVYNDDKG